MQKITKLLALLGGVLVAGHTWAAEPSLEGSVRDPSGRPLSGADVRIEARDGSSWNQLVKTNENGRYYFSGLKTDATYRVSLLVNSTVQASINNVTIKSSRDPNELNFKLARRAASTRTVASAKRKHMVWVPEDTGSHLGGRWVEAADNPSGVTGPGAQNVKRTNGGAVATITTNGGHNTNGFTELRPGN